MADWQGSAVTQRSQLLSLGAVAAMGAAAGFGLMYWHMRHLQRQPSTHDGSKNTHSKERSTWRLAWPWSSRESSRLLQGLSAGIAWVHVVVVSAQDLGLGSTASAWD